MKTTLLVLGYWAPAQGPLTVNVPDYCDVLSLLSIDSMEERVRTLNSYLREHRSITTLIGHSAGAMVIVKAGTSLPSQITKIVMVNPAPMPGVKFGFNDPVFWMMMKPRYLWSMMFGKSLALTPKDAGRLLGLPEDHEIVRSLKPDSARAIRQSVLAQYAKKKQAVFNPKIVVVACRTLCDNMVGSTQVATEELLNPAHALVNRYGSATHVTDLVHLQELMREIYVLE